MKNHTKNQLLSFLIILTVSLIITGCEEGEKVQDSTSFQYFRENVIPILEKKCAGACHGIAEDSYDEFMQDATKGKSFYFPINPRTGKIADNGSQVLAYKAVIGKSPFAKEKSHRIDYSEKPAFSDFLRIPLAEESGGLPHRGKDIFYSTEDKDYKTIFNWLSLELLENPKAKKILSEEAAFFRDNIQGMMVRKGCFLASCHGPQVFNDLKLTPPLPVVDKDIDDGFSTKMTLQNRAVVLGNNSHLVNLGGDMARSRLIVKNLPISEGGVHQRGGNNQFFESLKDPNVQMILDWLKLEKKALVSKLSSQGKPIAEEEIGKLKGMVFIRGPRHTPRNFFDFREFYPGSDIYLLKLEPGETLETSKSKPINITQQLHPNGEVEIQSVDVRYDAKTIVFSMRKSKETGFRIYEAELNDALDGIKTFRQISFGKDKLDDGTVINHLDPIYTPHPDDDHGHILDKVAIAYVSNKAGEYAASDTWGILGEADGGGTDSIIDIQRMEKPGTFDGRRLYIVDGPNKGEWRRITKHLSNKDIGTGSILELDHPLPYEADPRTVYVIEKLEAKNLPSYALWRFVPLQDETPETAFNKTDRRASYSTSQVRRPTMRTTGEFMITTVRNMAYQGDRPVFNGAIYRLQAGGFDYHIQGGNRSGYPIYADSRELPSGLEVRMTLDPRNFWEAGSLFLVDHGFGINAEPNNPMDNIAFTNTSRDVKFSSPPRFIPTQLPFFSEIGKTAVTHTGLSLGGSYKNPYPLSDGRILVSRVVDSIDHLDANSDPDWDIYILEFEESLQSEDGQKVGPIKQTRINAASTKMADSSPRPIVIRIKEKSKRHQKFGFQESGIKPKDDYGVLRMPPDTPAEIQCYDYPLLQSFLINFAPVGSKDFHIAKGNPSGRVTDEDKEFHYARIIMQVPPTKDDLRKVQSDDPFSTTVSKGIHTKKLIVSEVPIEKDGSFYAEVPPNVPLIIQGLNKDKRALHSMNRWFYTQPGEKLTFSIPRSIFPMRCSGCHGSLTGKPADAFGPIDLVSGASRVMANWDSNMARRREPYGKGQKQSDFISIDYMKDIQPILNKNCVSCHGGKSLEAGLDLSAKLTKAYNISYESLHKLREPESGNQADKKYINEREGLSGESLIIDKLLGTNSKSHDGGNPLSEDELLTLIRWIDLGATFKGGK